MNDLKRIEGKTILNIERDYDGNNSYMIMKFKEGGKANISAYPHGDDSAAQLDIFTSGLKTDDLVGEQIQNVIEEYDGMNDYIYFIFKNGGKLSVSAFGSSEESGAGLSIDVYLDPATIRESYNLVAESFKEATRNNG